ncbi:hypothetical protein [Actinokineospora cianjurensis]|uniref:Uncharacterized protein n=1 Tax=Actinokineospora cianjurensis TaxID=585224 RepID=A0A421AWE2_9PSEU|nr:hypothetical protein [Actinokineospora cianjurensis]RLK53837.1 hypothetical protein CLV68_6501 [Actinokineospora cianjurensis]
MTVPACSLAGVLREPDVRSMALEAIDSVFRRRRASAIAIATPGTTTPTTAVPTGVATGVEEPVRSSRWGSSR